MTYPSKREAAVAQLKLHRMQLDRLERLLNAFQGYKEIQESTFMSALNVLSLLGTSSHAIAYNETLNETAKGLRIEDIFIIGSTINMDEVNQRELEVLTEIYRSMRVSFQHKSFSFSNLFRKAQELMETQELSVDAADKIIRLIQVKYEKIRQFTTSIWDILHSQTSAREKKPSQGETSSYQNGGAVSRSRHSFYHIGSTNFLAGRLVFSATQLVLEHEMHKITAMDAGRRGYTEIKSNISHN